AAAISRAPASRKGLAALPPGIGAAASVCGACSRGRPSGMGLTRSIASAMAATFPRSRDMQRQRFELEDPAARWPDLRYDKPPRASIIITKASRHHREEWRHPRELTWSINYTGAPRWRYKAWETTDRLHGMSKQVKPRLIKAPQELRQRAVNSTT